MTQSDARKGGNVGRRKPCGHNPVKMHKLKFQNLVTLTVDKPFTLWYNKATVKEGRARRSKEQRKLTPRIDKRSLKIKYLLPALLPPFQSIKIKENLK